jgi:hypothetical protein
MVEACDRKGLELGSAQQSDAADVPDSESPPESSGRPSPPAQRIDKPTHSIPGACQQWSDTLAKYRFLENPRVDHRRILSGHKASTVAQQQADRRERELSVVGELPCGVRGAAGLS